MRAQFRSRGHAREHRTGIRASKCRRWASFASWFCLPDGAAALPLGIVQLGSLKLATVPTETSTAAVWQIRDALGRPPHGELEFISMANEYTSYLATEDEYQTQDYMGASTLWGPEQARFFAAVLKRLDAEPNQTVSGTPGEDRPGKAKLFRLGDVGPLRARPQDGFEDLLDTGLINPRHLPTFEWCDAAQVTIAAGPRQVEVVSNNGPERGIGWASR